MKKLRLLSLKKYKEEIYTSIQINHLILYGLYSILKRGEKCTFEKLVAECFNFFPKTFGFIRFPEWPDAMKFDRPLRTLRRDGLIIGNSKTALSLTRFGERVAINTENILSAKTNQFIATKNKSIGRKDTDINLLQTLKNSDAFHKYLDTKGKFEISNMELRRLFKCTLETPVRVLKQNISYAIKVAEEFKDRDLENFSEICYKKINS